MTDYLDEADRLIRSGNVSANAAAVAYAVLALAQAFNDSCYCDGRPVVTTPKIKGDML